MSLSGKLEDVSLADVMQFIHLGRRTGTLSLERSDERAEINFHRGAIVGAWAPSSRRLGELLLEKEILDEAGLEQALERQRQERPRRSLGQILLSSGLVGVAEVRRAVRAQIERTIYELVTWSHGTFVFELDTLNPVDDIAIYPGDLIPDIDLNTQMVLLEAARIRDEQQAGREPSGPVAEAMSSLRERAEPVSEPEADGPSFESLGVLEVDPASELWRRVILVSRDEALVTELDERLARESVDLQSAEPTDVADLAGGPNPPILMIDIRPGQLDLETMIYLGRRVPDSPMIALVDDVAVSGAAYEAGAVAVSPARADAVVGCFHSVARVRGNFARTVRPERLGSSGFAKLRRVVTDLRSGVLSATVALNLMNIIAESVERAILFLVKDGALTSIGAFGFSPAGQPLAEATRSLRLSLDDDNALVEAVRVGHALSVGFDEARLPDRMAELVGRPEADQVVLFPVLGSDRVILVIYTDNGSIDRPIEEIDIIDLATAQVGMAFENEMLRRQLARQGS